jgi:hypothetical protein
MPPVTISWQVATFHLKEFVMSNRSKDQQRTTNQKQQHQRQPSQQEQKNQTNSETWADEAGKLRELMATAITQTNVNSRPIRST